MGKLSAYGINKAIEKSKKLARIKIAIDGLSDELKIRLGNFKGTFLIDDLTDQITFTSNDKSLADEISAFLIKHPG